MNDANHDAVMMRERLVGERRMEEAAHLAEKLAAEDNAEAQVSAALLAHLAGDFEGAVRACEAALARTPGLATAYNHLGRALHNLGATREALESFEQAVAAEPGYAEAWHNLGHALRAQGRLEEAITTFKRAVARAPDFRMARLNLGITLANLEEGADALVCFEVLLEHDADDVEALVNAGLCLQLLGRFDDAQDRYERAIALTPDYPPAYTYLGVLLNERLDTDGACAALERALQLDPQDVVAWVELAGVHEQSNRLDQAEAAIRHAQALAPDDPGLQLEAAKLARRRGDAKGAADRLQAIDPQQLPARIAQQYFFELGQALDRTGDYEGAYEAFEQGNALSARNPRRAGLDPDAFPSRCARLRRWLEAGAPGAESRLDELSGDVGADLCFLVGFPRSGTTLLDTMLNVLPGVVSIEERLTLEAVVAELDALPGEYPEALATLPASEVTRLRALYRATIAPLLPEGKHRLIVDSLHLRSLDAGLIHRLFPEARLLFVLRHPCDVVLSNFMQDYAVNEAFIHFDTLENSCRTYHDVMRVWRAAADRLPLNVETLRYERLVAEPEVELDRVCAFLGVERTQAMLDAEARLKARGRVRTNSYQQVAEPLYQRASGRWQHYHRVLEPHLPLLAAHIEAFGYE